MNDRDSDRYDDQPADSMVLAVRRRQFDQHCAKQLAEIARETGSALPERDPKMLSLLGDEQQLRGIPAIGRGVTGAIPGTRPGQ